MLRWNWEAHEAIWLCFEMQYFFLNLCISIGRTFIVLTFLGPLCLVPFSWEGSYKVGGTFD